MAEIQLQQVSKSYDGQVMAVQAMDLRCPQGEMLALLGPSGCGKSSTLKMVAGIESVTSGEILFDGVDVTRRDSASRNVAMVFEDYALYPHMSVRENIAFPLRVRRTNQAIIAKKVGDVMDLLGLSPMADAAVQSLSGGAQQRVSIGRALVRDPALVMFDEPLSHLDADQKVVLRTEIRRMQSTQGLTSVLVTHDQTEAMAMADRIAVMNLGVLQQVGSPQALYERPANRFVAGFIGDTPMNFLDAVLDADGGVRLPGLIDLPEGARLMPADVGRPGSAVVLGIRPEDVVLRALPVGEPGLRLMARFVDRECGGDRDVLRLSSDAGPLHVEAASPCRLYAGDTVVCCLPPSALHFFDPLDGRALGARGLDS
jgi:multiple sugar transport system ATP-binding protein